MLPPDGKYYKIEISVKDGSQVRYFISITQYLLEYKKANFKHN